MAFRARSRQLSLMEEALLLLRRGVLDLYAVRPSWGYNI
jgi:hypothetical protein